MRGKESSLCDGGLAGIAAVVMAARDLHAISLAKDGDKIMIVSL
jgi:hypothetical protein